MSPKKKPPVVTVHPRKMADKVKLENMTDEAWAHELVRCRFVIEDCNWRRKANKATLNAPQAATSAAAYTA
jgi:hypothetical protein